MPYRARGNVVLVKRKGKWVRFAVRASAAAAQRQATALNMRLAGIPPKKKRKKRRSK